MIGFVKIKLIAWFISFRSFASDVRRCLYQRALAVATDMLWGMG
jgi:hypothetical protein